MNMNRKTAIFSGFFALFVLLAGFSIATADTEGVSEFGTAGFGTGYSTETVRNDGLTATSIALVDVNGPISSEGDGGTGGVSADQLIGLLDSFVDSDVEGIILEVNSPGGTVVASDEIEAAVRRVRDSDIPVVVWMRDVAASGGYYIAAPADHIVAHPATITGSLGVILSYPVIDGLTDEIGVEEVVIKSGQFKDIGSIFRDITPAERDIFQQMIQEAYGEFVDVIAEGRDMPRDRVLELADGRIYTGKQAVENGLADSLGGWEEAQAQIERLAGSDELTITRYLPEVGFWDVFLASGSIELPGGLAIESGTVTLPDDGMPRLEYRAGTTG